MKTYRKSRLALLGFGILCLFYWLFIHILYGTLTFIHSFFLLGVLAIGIALSWDHMRLISSIHLPQSLRRMILLLLGAGIVVFGWEEVKILTAAHHEDSEHGDTILILGAGLINGNEISRSLQYRLETGLEEHQKNPDAMIIVSGGKGNDEDMSEAQAMKQWLIAHDVSAQQILMEDQSHNTYENFCYSRELMNKYGIQSNHVSLITNRFHMRRARYLGEAQGLRISQKPAPDLLFSEPCMYTREFFAMIRVYLFNR